MHETVYLNGDLVPLSEAKISVLDRGFIFGDGVYEVIPAYRRTLFRLKEHLARLAYSLAEIRLNNPHDDATWTRLLQTVVDRNPWDDQSVYLQVTRGVAPRAQEFPKSRHSSPPAGSRHLLSRIIYPAPRTVCSKG